ncbi:MAG: GTP-binding protein [Lachnospiraceae bacterium]
MLFDREIPVFVINGFLESGKTIFAMETIVDPYFSEGEDTLIIACEEGMEEYDEDLLKEHDAQVVYVESKEAFTTDFLKSVQKKYKPSQIMIEYNGMWGMDLLREMEKPRGWFLAQAFTLVDAVTFDVYMQNMKSLFMDMCRDSDVVIFNRCQEGTDAASYKRNIRAVNPRAQVAFEKENGEPFEFEEELPFDIEADVIEIREEDYGIWYIDALDHPEKYEGKTVKFKGMVYRPKKMPKDQFVPGRMAMTCCADDTAFIGYICEGVDGTYSTRDWVILTAGITIEERREYEGRGVVLHAVKIEAAEPAAEEFVYF